MKAKDWKFTKYLVDEEDVDAIHIAITNFIKLVGDLNIEMSDIDIFCCGFTRGLKWAIDKYEFERFIDIYDKLKKLINMDFDDIRTLVEVVGFIEETVNLMGNVKGIK